MNGQHTLRRWMKKCWMPLAIFIILLAILFSLFRALTPWATQYKGDIERHLSSILGQPVAIQSMETSWYWFEPVLKLNQVTVSDAADHVLTLNKLLVGINLLSSIWHWHIQPGILYVDDVHLTLREVGDHWQMDGLGQGAKLSTADPAAYLPVMAWVLSQQKIIVKNASIFVHFSDGMTVPVSAINVTAVNNNGRYRIKAAVKLDQLTATEFLMLADLQLKPYTFTLGSGHAYIAARHLLPGQWQRFFPSLPYTVDNGQGGFEVWLDLAKGHLSGVQTRFHFKHVAWRNRLEAQHRFIQALRANLAWKSVGDGWQLSGDQIQLRMAGVTWPENAFLVEHKTSPESYHVVINSLLIEPLLAEDIAWPDIFRPLLAMHPQGELHDTEVNISNGAMTYLLTRFDDLGWRGYDYFPAVNHVSGVLHWQPTVGRLELNGDNTTIVFKDKPPVTFTQLNTALDWQTLSHGLRISMDRFILSRPDLVLSAEGALDEPFTPATRNLRLKVAFSAKNAHQWMIYLPSQYLKPKLDDWLKQDIKRIGALSGQLNLRGPLADFPFDKAPGDFSIVSYVTGVDLWFNKRWPLNRDVDATLRFDKRSLDVDVFHALLKGVLVDKVNLHLDDMGLDKETLLVHGHVEAPADKFKAYVFASPLKRSLSRITAADISGDLGLDLRLEVPLYPNNDDVLAVGTLSFDDNDVFFHHALHGLELRHFQGALQFNEHGVTDSTLKTTLFGYPITMQIQSLQAPKAGTDIHIEGNTTVEVLSDKFKLPLSPLMQGQMHVQSRLVLTDDTNGMDHLEVHTSLEGVGIDLPAPLGKSPEQSAPFTAKMDFNLNKALRLGFNYDQRLGGEVSFLRKDNAFEVDNGLIRLGARQVLTTPKKRGLSIVGALPVVDVSEWRKALSNLPTDTSSSTLFDAVSTVDLKLGQLVIWGKRYPEISIVANKLAKEDWALVLNQRDIAGELRYQQASNLCSGHLSRLNLASSVLLNKETNIRHSSLKPTDIPNLKLNIDAMKVGEVDIGSVELKSTSAKERWHLDVCQIKSKAYQLTVKGDWIATPKQNNTTLEARVDVLDVAEGLKNWKITPVIEAHKGLVQFNGGWLGAVNDFSLAKVNGQLYMELKNGRITNLSPETEEKLGLGKVLSILSLQTIPRRLKLDFSDLSSGGYSFDVFKGSFSLKKGVLSTSDSYIDGPVAYASVKGSFDVVQHLYDDLQLHVSPHITASLPVVATIAGGPIAGMAAWVASKIINQGMQQVTGYSYKVSGPWLNPVVQQVSIFKKQQ